MSDLLSPLLYVTKDEALSYVCFCALMDRCDYDVFSDRISVKIELLTCLLRRYDAEFWAYLVRVGAEQLLFVYRWLLIECKREFSLDDALSALEVMWSTIAPNNSSSSSSNNNNNVTCWYTNLNKSSMSSASNINSSSCGGPERSVSNASSISIRILKQIDPAYSNATSFVKSRKYSPYNHNYKTVSSRPKIPNKLHLNVELQHIY